MKRLLRAVEIGISNTGPAESTIVLDEESRMGNPPSWDSMAYMAIVESVCEEFNIKMDMSEALAFTSIEGMMALVCSGEG